MAGKELLEKYVDIKTQPTVTFNCPNPMGIGEIVPCRIGEDEKHTIVKVINCEYDKEIEMYKITFELGDPLSFPPSECIVSCSGK